MTLRIGVAQMQIVPGDVAANRARALELTRDALGRGADIVLLPEGMNTGYCRGYTRLAEPANGPTAEAFRALLRGTRGLALAGIVERDGERYHQAALLVGARGIVAHYRKTHLWWAARGVRDETRRLTAGERLVTFPVRGVRCGVMICYDGDFPEMTRSYAALGCRIVFWLNMRGSRGHAEVKDLAARNSMIIAASCNTGSDEAGRPCPGGSNITDHQGTLLAELWEREGVILADVDPSRVPAARRANPWFTGRRPELYI